MRRVSPRFNEHEEVDKMPAKSMRQQRFMGMQLGKKRAGKPTAPKSKKPFPPKPKSKFEMMDDSDAMV